MALICEHKDKPEHAKGLCRPCYEAERKASKIAESKSEEELAKVLESGDFSSQTYVNKFIAIMWEWVGGVEKARTEEIWETNEDGKKRRNRKLEIDALKAATELGSKAATVLKSLYIVERVVDETPKPLPLAGASKSAAGWLEAGGVPKDLAEKIASGVH